MSTSTAYQYATGEGGIGLDAMNENIRKFFAGAPTEEATRAAMSQYGVSDEDIRRATGKSLAEFYPAASSTAPGALSTATATGALPTSGFDAFGNPRGNTWTEDRYNPNDPASSRYIADPNAGQYVFDQVTGKPTLVSSTSALSTATATDALPTTSFDAFGNQKSGTWTEDRYNPNDPASKSYLADPNAGQYVFDPVTGKPKLVSSTGATSVTGNVAPIGSLAYQSATGKGGIGLDAMNQNILNYLSKSPTEVATLAEAKKWGVSKEDIERATGKTYEQIFPETFRPGSVLSSGFGNVIEQLRGSGYYKGVAIPTFREYGGDDNNPPQTVADQLAAWKANIDRQDLSARAPFGFVETPVYTPGSGDSDAYISGYQAAPATALDYLTKNNPVIANAVYGHTSTDARAYKVVNGELKEVGQDQITPEDIAQGNAFFMLAGKTGGPNRERMAQLYRADGDNLIPVGDPKMYKGAVEQDMGLTLLDMAASALSFVPGPWQIPAVAYKAVRGAMAGDWAEFAKAFLPAPVATAVNVYEAFDSKDPFRIATALMGTDVLPEIGSFDLGAGVTVKDAVLAAKAVEAINNGQWDVAAIIGGQLSGSSELTAAGQGLRIKNAIERGDYMGAMSAVQGLNSTINKLSTAPPNLLNEIAFQEANASPLGLSALSPIAAEDEQIAIQQRVTKANQAIADYAGPGNDLSREGLVSQLQSFGLTADQAEGYAQQADQRINMNRVGADVMSRYSKIDPEFGIPQLDRDTATQELVAAGFTSDRANEILNGIDAQNAIKLENKLSVQSAYQNFTQGTGSEDQLRSALTSAGYSDAQINELVTRGRGVIAGSQLTGGEQAQERASLLPDIRGEIAGKSNFNEAYALARDKLGADATFTWQGKTYSTATAAERPDLSGATSKPTAEVPYVAPNGMHNRAAFIQAGGGTSDADYAKYVQAVNAVIAEGKSGTLITPASVNSTGKEMPSTKGPVTMEKPAVDSVLGSVAAQGVASFGANSIAGVLSALGFTDAGRTVLDKANQIAAAATAAEGADITQGKRDINAAIQRVGESSGIKDFATNVGNLVSTAFNNPKAFGATVGSEVVEEVLQLATLKFPGSFLVKETVASALENGGAAYNTEYESQIAKGASKEDAHLAAQKAAGTAAGVTVALAGGAAGLGKVAGKVFGSQADEAASGVSQVGRTTLKESAQEVLEEGSIAGSIDLALGRPIDAVNALTNMTGGALYGGVTAGSMQGTKLDTLDQAASTSIGAGVQASFNNTLAQTGNIAQASTNSVTTAINNGLDPGAAVSTVISTAAQSGVDMSTTIASSVNTGISTALSNGADASATVSTIVAGSVTASLNNGVNVTTAIDSTVGSSVKTGIATGADASTVVASSVNSAVSTALSNGASVSTVVTGAVNSAVTSGLAAGADASTVIASSVTAAVSTATQNGANATAVVAGSTSTAVSTAIASGVGASTAINSAVDSATKAGADTSVATASSITAAVAAGTDTNTAIAAATGANSNITANSTTNNNITSTVVTDTKTGVTSQTVVDSTNNASTTTTTNNNVTSQVTTVGSTTTTVTSDTSTGVTTQTTVDGTRSTDVTVDTTTNVTTQVVTDTNTNTKVTVEWEPDGETRCTFTDPEGRETVFDDLDVGDPPKVDIVAPLEPVKPEVKPETPKETKPKTSQSGSGSAIMMPAMAGAAAAVDWLGPQFLKSKERGAYVDPLAEFQALQQANEQQDLLKQIQPELANVLTERGAMPYYAYGQEPSIDEVLGLPDQESSSYNESDYVPVFRTGGKVSPLNIQMMYAKGGHAREDFRDGKHVAGPGDGQSDDIPAWLADGEFVFPADVVSALGNGSTKAGTEKLYKMMHEIRGRARSKHPKDLPPPAHKSPLDYLKKGK